VITKFLSNINIVKVQECFNTISLNDKTERINEIVTTKISPTFNQQQKLNQLFDCEVKEFMKIYGWKIS